MRSMVCPRSFLSTQNQRMVLICFGNSIAYAYVVRHFAASPLASLSPDEPDCAEAKRVITQLVPFLADRRSTTVLKSISGTVTDLWSRFPPVSHRAP